MTGEELLEEANSPDVEYNDDGTVWLYYKNQKIEITDKFKDDVCYVKVQDGDETLYVTVKYRMVLPIRMRSMWKRMNLTDRMETGRLSIYYTNQ